MLFQLPVMMLQNGNDSLSTFLCREEEEEEEIRSSQTFNCNADSVSVCVRVCVRTDWISILSGRRSSNVY